ncbi:MAG TPA: TIGR01459 family HAD-type hydrolase [Hyphomonas sp.]|uniref:TIGR01459 family HAD-type hydrolase n=1 Tax=unclassified Hyphomonas TaxID=2630699 RepID=UPI000C5E228A|nr:MULTISPECIES: TIGR01459 family HAD-type hydrolase [unclassified Hyphomonas]MAN89510.1 TIGR01459 family HAD-type hydrolase [Hyphomonadaceae bacterium]HAQ77758.1 TIGR01459 family HAD-type hydrolase [Hyphomonas sp.]HBL92924.1 TIGR01459 family HAD-type hydrolase [Hyphomonas sp.]HBX96106.1 TIGR01459 family HAD-type hydrolase [Hyphomonas sp.]HCN93970.1 TIGR01459 family HAD-type hydrolase [Hyphomonas sp.]|tara:strand:+ start:10142 stop:10993 length:852 start_codon:yes stop_codon:yes gene_type:complete
MTQLKFPGGLSEIAGQYDAILCDVWGVIHNGRDAFEEACVALVNFREQGGKVCLITNAPVPKQQVIDYFLPLGVPTDAYDDCVSSGDATREELAKRRDKVFWAMGANARWERDPYLYQGLNLSFGEPDESDVLLCIGLSDSLKDHPSDYTDTLKQGVDRNIPMICANPDKQVRIGGQLHWCAGALAEIYEDLGGSVIYPGKPHAAIYDLAVSRVGDAAANKSRVLCIGDSPTTDMRGARIQGFDGLYVGTGLIEHGADFQAEVSDLLADYGEEATYAMTGLRW